MAILGFKMNGIKRCEMFRSIRKRICENNGIPFEEEKCRLMRVDCLGTCPACDRSMERIGNLLAEMERSGKEIDYSGIREIYLSYTAAEEK